MSAGRVQAYRTRAGDEPRWRVEYRIGGRLGRKFHGGSFLSEEEAVERLAVVAEAIADDRPVPPTRGPERVYFIEGGGLTKIGRATDVAARLADMQTGSPVPLTLVYDHAGPAGLERELHHHFRQYRKHGEWFDLPDEWWRSAWQVLDRLA